MVGFTKAELAEYRNAPVDDLVEPGISLLFVGINPGLWTAATKTHFCHPSNRFYPALRKAGLIDWEVDTDVGMTDEQRRDFLARGMGITNLVNRATVRASELSRAELQAGGVALRERIEQIRPRVVAVAGVTAYRDAFGDRAAQLGRQDDLGESELWAIPNPSGLNAHETIDTLSVWFATVAGRAGLRDE